MNKFLILLLFFNVIGIGSYLFWLCRDEDIIEQFFEIFSHADTMHVYELLLVPVLLLMFVFLLIGPILLKLTYLLLKTGLNKVAKLVGKIFKKPVASFKELMLVEVKIPKFRIRIERGE